MSQDLHEKLDNMSRDINALNGYEKLKNRAKNFGKLKEKSYKIRRRLAALIPLPELRDNFPEIEEELRDNFPDIAVRSNEFSATRRKLMDQSETTTVGMTTTVVAAACMLGCVVHRLCRHNLDKLASTLGFVEKE